MYRYTQQRRGVVLMIVLSLLTLFMLMGVTFLISSRQYVKGARARATHEIVGVDPRKHQDEAVYQLLRGTKMKSAIGPHSILEDIFGGDSIKATAESVTPENFGGGQGNFFVVSFTTPTGFDTTTNYYSGRVVSFFNYDQSVPLSQRPAGPVSTRIAESGIDPGDSARAFLRVERFEADQLFNLAALNNCTFLINGQPFNGTGAGYDPGTQNVDAMETLVDGNGGNQDLEVALLPNFSVYTTGQQANRGGADESYDVVDYQDMWLAMVPPRATNSQDVIPSFHRPALANYWFKWVKDNVLVPSGVTTPADQIKVFADPYGRDQIPNNADENVSPWDQVSLSQRQFIVQLKSHFILRPLPELHPGFPDPDPNPNSAWELGGPWDVDNDNDGIPDSIWIDIGLPAFTAMNGRAVKPLVAILVKDMDGRLNVNAHGNYVQLSSNSEYTDTLTIDRPPNAPHFFPEATGPITLPRGSGYGPAEIGMGHIFSGTEFDAVLEGKYGADLQPGLDNNDDTYVQKARGVPQDYVATTLSSYASPPDVWGRNAVALDFAGLPYYHFVNSTTPNATQTEDEPYELDLSAVGSDAPSDIDTPYTNADLERLLRWFDGDAASHPSRLMSLAGTTLNGATTDALVRRSLLTTESRHLPLPNVGWLIRDTGKTESPTIIDLYVDRMSSVPPADLDQQLTEIVPLEMLRGQLLNLNRYFGNGEDDNGNGLVDETTESDPMYNGTFMSDPGYARHMFARNLYCLMLLLIDDQYVMPSVEPELDATERQELTRRRIAQWAINVVDFRDPDAIMSPFEYDVNPFNGWDVDGGLGTADDTHPERRLVWGSEFPDLLITEGMALHDRRVGDTKHDGGDMDTRQQGGSGKTEGDDDLDQIRKPQGSVFLEFYCPRSRRLGSPPFPGGDPVFPAELYDTSNGRLRLTAVAPPRPGPAKMQQPVWRVVLTKSSAGPSVQDRSRSSATPGQYSTSFEPSNMNLIRTPEPLTADRIVWFAAMPPEPALPDANKVYYGRSGNLQLPPGHYAVLGPRPVTHMGSRTRDPAKPELHVNSPQRIVLGPGVNVFNAAGNNAAYLATPKKTPLGIVAAADIPAGPAGWIDSTGKWAELGIGISLTEPLPSGDYYPEPTFLYEADKVANGGNGVPEGYDHEDPSQRDISPEAFPDEPLDNSRILGPGNEDNLKTQWLDDYASAFLQRLANPTLPWNPQPGQPGHTSSLPINPFITVDWSTLDLTVFNGEDREPADYPDTLDPWDPSDPDPDSAVIHFASRERGDPTQTGDQPDNRLWPPDSTQPATTNKSGPPENHFQYNLIHSYGFLNRPMGNPLPSPPYPAVYVGDPGGATVAPAPPPPAPFPWLTWLNRPFHNPLELMLVPTSSQARLLHEFTLAGTANVYDADNSDPASDFAPYGHLLNFFQTGENPGDAAHFYRLFDYVETPSPFAGAERYYDRTIFQSAPNLYETPFNYLSRFRDTGRININTLFDVEIFRGVTTGFPFMDPWGPDGQPGIAGTDDDGDMTTDNVTEYLAGGSDDVPTWEKLLLSRQGYPGVGLDDTKPTRFANPFRSAHSADLAPLADLRQLNSVQATLLRSAMPDPPATTPTEPLFDVSHAEAYHNTDRNPYFRYQGVSRLSNLFTTHSNVFAVWITVGYFEVERQIAPSKYVPDGYILGRELGSEGGITKTNRHRAFYLIDRSIPVAFETGVNHNVDRVILVKRFIE